MKNFSNTVEPLTSAISLRNCIFLTQNDTYLNIYLTVYINKRNKKAINNILT